MYGRGERFIRYDYYDEFYFIPADYVAAVRRALLDISTRTDEGRKILGRRAHINGFVDVGDDHYDEVRRVARLVEDSSAASP